MRLFFGEARDKLHELGSVQLIGVFLARPTEQKLNQHLTLFGCLAERDLSISIGIQPLEEPFRCR